MVSHLVSLNPRGTVFKGHRWTPFGLIGNDKGTRKSSAVSLFPKACPFPDLYKQLKIKYLFFNIATNCQKYE